MAAENIGDVVFEAREDSVTLRLGHPMPGRDYAVLTYREAALLGGILASLSPPRRVERPQAPPAKPGLFD